jgi:RimJ/RimL family protein N-acetyltransferase
MAQKALGKFRTRLVVYRHGVGQFDSLQVPAETVVRADSNSIEKLFADEPDLQRRFHDFVAQGQEGVFLLRDGHWASYGWFSRPGGAPPGHLPAWVANQHGCWIFFCHTREAFRGQGLFRRLLRHMVSRIAREGIAPVVYIDALTTNTPSRRAILSAGFTPWGVLTTRQLWLPGIGSTLISSSWRIEEAHPPLLETVRRPPGAQTEMCG